MKHTESVEKFEIIPDEGGITIRAWMLLSGRSRASTYRDINAGKLESFHIGKSTRIRVGSCRRVLRGE